MIFIFPQIVPSGQMLKQLIYWICVVFCYCFLNFFKNKGHNHCTLTMICKIVMAINLDLQKLL